MTNRRTRVRRPVVVDLAYGSVRVDRPEGGRASADVTELLDAIDSASVLVDGRLVMADRAWHRQLATLGVGRAGEHGPGDGGAGGGGAGDGGAGGGGGAGGDLTTIVGHPTTWAARRVSVLARAVSGTDTELVPRAVLVARSHSDVVMQRCVVVETTHVPHLVADPGRPPLRHWDVTVVRRAANGWEIERASVIDPDDALVGQRIEETIDDDVEAVFVDGAEPGRVRDAIEAVTTYALAGRVVAVDRGLVRRYGWRTGADDPVDAVGAPAEQVADIGGGRTRRPLVWAAAALALVVAAVAVVVGLMQRQGDDQPTDRTAQLGRVSLNVPADWRESGSPPPSGTASDGPGSPRTDTGPTRADEAPPERTVFADRADGRRILVVQTELRDASTLASVATSLRNRIRQRGDDVVSEFSPSTRFMGREVISYREAPASGSGIRWYVLVDEGLQVSIGCQAGTAAEPVDTECAAAVASTAVAPR
ncbi:type VII secretion-associated protein [Gordonia soli]|uniref:Type VII secretion-associated protein n=1 Tax=Gordonia soli NBRC 108243 TaxID=1223545 RepID=M0QQ35_9ACTN|nr:type VII secretion-associated protein [Gordonia soli]GAC70499.1 hypothetical protein GS4_35_00750 [Gordonia soli NBRC 108243]